MATNEISETDRLEALRRLRILDTVPEKSYSEIVSLAAYICGTPISAISLIDDNRQWFKAILGLNIQETPRDIAFCSHTIQSDDIFLVPDAQKDQRFSKNELVTGDPDIRFYAGAPLILSDGLRLGALCVIDKRPRSLTSEQLNALAILSRLVVEQIENSQRVQQLEEQGKLLVQRNIQLNNLTENMPVAFYRGHVNKSGDLTIKYLSEKFSEFLGYSNADILENANLLTDSIHPIDRLDFQARVRSSLEAMRTLEWEGRFYSSDGVAKWIRATSMPSIVEDGIIWDGLFIDIEKEKYLEASNVREKQLSAEISKFASYARLASGVATELSDPLTIINGFTSILDKNLDEEKINIIECKEICLTLHSNVNRISNVVRFMQNISYSETDAEFETVFLKDVLDLSIALAQKKTKTHFISPAVKCNPAQRFRCRKNNLADAFSQFLINSQEALAVHSEAWIHVDVDVAGKSIRVTFQDSGPTVKKELQPFIFDPFYTTKQAGQGKGLGLAIAKMIIDSHDGSIVMEKDHPFSTFVISLPIISENRDDDA
ncbi:MAG: GAF domain-containing protein [Pedobacter sp.]|nr:MAG: GAF domain-containing protein [Pedobacter sp.]